METELNVSVSPRKIAAASPSEEKEGEEKKENPQEKLKLEDGCQT